MTLICTGSGSWSVGGTVLGRCGWVTSLETRVCGSHSARAKKTCCPVKGACVIPFSFLRGLYPVSHTQCPVPGREGGCPLKACFQEWLPLVSQLALLQKCFIYSREVGGILAIETGSPGASWLLSCFYFTDRGKRSERKSSLVKGSL